VAALHGTSLNIFGLPVKFDEHGEVAGASFVISQVTGGKFKQVFP